MAYYNMPFPFAPESNIFNGYDGDYGPIPPGQYFPPTRVEMFNPNPPPPFDYGLPPVDPFNYPGVRFGPSFTIIGPHLPDIPPGAGVFDPYLIVPGAATLQFTY